MSTKLDTAPAHTPGPWMLLEGDCFRYENNTARKIIGARGTSMVVMVRNDPGCLRANARLIAAAPELLDACKSAHRALDLAMAMLVEAKREFMPSKSGKIWDSVVELNAVISKAAGRSPLAA